MLTALGLCRSHTVSRFNPASETSVSTMLRKVKVGSAPFTAEEFKNCCR